MSLYKQELRKPFQLSVLSYNSSELERLICMTQTLIKNVHHCLGLADKDKQEACSGRQRAGKEQANKQEVNTDRPEQVSEAGKLQVGWHNKQSGRVLVEMDQYTYYCVNEERRPGE